MSKKVREIVDAPTPSPEALQAAREAGAELVGWDPDRLRAFIAGKITLGDLEGIDKAAQYRMAEMAYKLLAEGKVDQAREAFEGLFVLDPYDAYFLTALGTIAQQQGNLEEAEARFSRALEINPFSTVALTQRAEIRALRGELEAAVADIGRALAEDPEGKDPATQRARAMAHALRTELEKVTAKATPDADADGGA